MPIVWNENVNILKVLELKALTHVIKQIVNKTPHAISYSLHANVCYLYSVFDGVCKAHDLIEASIQDR